MTEVFQNIKVICLRQKHFKACAFPKWDSNVRLLFKIQGEKVNYNALHVFKCIFTHSLFT